MNIVVLNAIPIFEQLQLEEALLRAGTGNWAIVNTGSDPAIVMGISQKREAHTDIPQIRRFSGGGTVVVDHNTVFCTLIFDEGDFPCEKNHASLMQWSSNFFAPIFVPYKLSLEEHDYVLDDKKIGGNAQSFACKRALHHTSFLWDWNPSLMAALSHPERQPAYRRNRSHDEFCNRLSAYFSTKETFLNALVEHIQQIFSCQLVEYEEAKAVLHLPHRKVLTQAF